MYVMYVCKYVFNACIMYVCMHVHMYVCMYLPVYMYECMYISMCSNVQMDMSVYLYVNRKAVRSVCLTVKLSHNRHRNTVLRASGTFT